MQLRHISPRSSEWVDAMDEGGKRRDWEKLAPEELTRLRQGEAALGGQWAARQREPSEAGQGEAKDYG
jgi:hypothetical protein